MKISILVNANAKAVRYKRIPVELFNRFVPDGISLKKTFSIEEIESTVEDCWNAGTDLVLLITGDGGLHRFISSFVNVYKSKRLDDGSEKKLPVFATLKSGTANLITGNLGGKGKPLKAAKRLFSKLQNVRTTQELPLIRQKVLNVSDGIQERFGFIAGSGLLYNFFLEYYEGSRHSLLKFYQILAKMILSLFTGTGYLNRLFASMEARIHLDERLEKLSQWKMLAVSAIDTKVVFFRAFRVGNLKNRIHVKGGNPSRFAIIRNIPNLLLNRRLKGRQLRDQLARCVSVERESEFGYTIDGELYNAKSLFFKAGPVVEFVRF